MKTMNDKYGDGSEHECCPKCGMCVDCGDCFCECGFEAKLKEWRDKKPDEHEDYPPEMVGQAWETYNKLKAEGEIV